MLQIAFNDEQQPFNHRKCVYVYDDAARQQERQKKTGQAISYENDCENAFDE